MPRIDNSGYPEIDKWLQDHGYNTPEEAEEDVKKRNEGAAKGVVLPQQQIAIDWLFNVKAQTAEQKEKEALTVQMLREVGMIKQEQKKEEKTVKRIHIRNSYYLYNLKTHRIVSKWKNVKRTRTK